MKKLLGILVLGLLVFPSSANITWTVNELSDNQIVAYIRGKINLYDKDLNLLKFENF